MPSLPGVQPSLTAFISLLEEWPCPPGLTQWFEAPPPATEKLCLSVVRGVADFRERQYSRRLTENQAATLAGWLCFAGTTTRQVAIIGRNQTSGRELLRKAGIVASRYLEKLLKPVLRDDGTGVLFRKLRQEYIKEWTRERIQPSNGPLISVWSTRASMDLEGILFIERGVRSPVQTFLGPQLSFRYCV